MGLGIGSKFHKFVDSQKVKKNSTQKAYNL
jgi:hypothetical protein